MGKVFISYAHEDETKARKIKDRLEEFGFSTWIDRSAPVTRDDISSLVDQEIDNVDSVLVLWSNNSRTSVWVRGEALSGLTRNKYFGLLLDPMIPPVPFNALSAPDLTDWSGLNDHFGWDALVRGLALLSSTKADILTKLDAAQRREREEAARLEAAQLPPDEEKSELDTGPAYIDVDSIMSAARTILSGAAKRDLAGTLTQATLDQEMLRDAAFVVSQSDKLPRPRGAKFKVVPTIGRALAGAKENDLIVITAGVWEECLVIKRNVRLVGLGKPNEKPVIRATAVAQRSTISFETSARIENLAVETRHRYHAIHCGAGQPVILRCDIRRFSDGNDDPAVWIAGRANPIILACSIAATGCAAVHTVHRSGGQFMGVHIISVRGTGVRCGGRAEFRGCTIEAIGAHALFVPVSGSPIIEECDISGRGESVVRVSGKSYPLVKESRVSAIRQLAFDFDAEASGRIEGNIISVERGEEAGTGRQAKSAFFGLLKSKEAAMVKAALNRDDFMRLKGAGRTIFRSNTTPDGEVLDAPTKGLGN